jgi:hypothetical protein
MAIRSRRTRAAPSRAMAAAGALVAALALSSCSSDGGTATSDDDVARSIDREATRTADPAPGTTLPTTTTEQPAPTEEDQMRIQITLGDQHVEAELDDSAASRDLLAQLPVTIEMRDHGSVEKTGRLPSPLSLDGQPAGADPEVGDLGYYAPGNDLVLYYGDQSYYDGIVVLGRMAGDAAERIAAIDGSVTAVVSVVR